MSKNIVILDYGSGNLRSAERAVARHGVDVTVTRDWDAAVDADGLIVPGVGAFSACMSGLRSVRGEQIIGRRLSGGRPVLGICVGMQILFAKGVEHGVTTEGCAEWPGTVERLDAPVVPHMGWNTVDAPVAIGSVASDGDPALAGGSGGSSPQKVNETVLFQGMDAGTRFYFVHSYGVRRWELEPDPAGYLKPPLVTWAEHGDRFVAAVENGPLCATQFHPEKSGDAGAQLLANWLSTVG
ncbi:imidazole glycerol phosphate synthase subunit HisH [Spirillospora sp. NPDC047279]|uniref:imidazole glycerol phosphate synthase subunit HisH n=1 Tax=Spirillospora sp. NPDC047279 TaxID=3155478 RepID=UPI003403DDF0